jgi:hypothetical protein
VDLRDEQIDVVLKSAGNRCRVAPGDIVGTIGVPGHILAATFCAGPVTFDVSGGTTAFGLTSPDRLIATLGSLSPKSFRLISRDFEIAAPVPEPATLVLTGTGLAFAFARRRRAARRVS